MLERLSDRWKAEAGGALVRAAIASAAAFAGALVLAFLGAAAFVVVLDSYGLTAACLAGAAFFLAVTLVLLAVYAAISSRRRRKIAAMEAHAAQETPSPLADPRLILVALQIIQAVGLRRMLPIVALGGAAFALAARRGSGRRRGRARDERAPP